MDRIAMLDSKLNSALWTEGETPFIGAELESGLEFDVAIIGGGFSGLWSAFHLLELEPTLKIAIFEAREIGYGASGRNGGWASTDYPVSKKTLIKRYGSFKYELLFHELVSSVDAIGDFAIKYAPAANFVKSGTLSFARNDAQLKRLKDSIDDGFFLLEKAELEEKIRVSGARSALFNPECATIQPYQLLKGLASYLRGRGVSIFTNAFASVTEDGAFVNSHFVKAKKRIQATEVFGAPGRDFIPLYSLMVATEPLPDSFWDSVGNRDRFTFAENSHIINYAQRTADNRLAIGGRGATYPFGSKLVESKERTAKVHEHIRSLARSWFPTLTGFKFTDAWGGAVAITRDWEPFVQWDSEKGVGRVGGYAGDGVTMSYLATKALAHIVMEKESPARELHFVGRKIRKWEPEPIRYFAINSLVKLSEIADREERFTKRASLLNKVIEPLILR